MYRNHDSSQESCPENAVPLLYREYRESLTRREGNAKDKGKVSKKVVKNANPKPQDMSKGKEAANVKSRTRALLRKSLVPPFPTKHASVVAQDVKHFSTTRLHAPSPVHRFSDTHPIKAHDIVQIEYYLDQPGRVHGIARVLIQEGRRWLLLDWGCIVVDRLAEG